MNKPEAVTPTGASTPCSKEEDRDLLFMLSDDLMCVATFEGRLDQVNPAWTRKLGWSEEELTGRPSIDFVVPEDRELTLNARNEVKQGQHVTHLENRYRCKDGSFRWLSWRSHPMVDVKKVFCVARDITEYKKIEHCLQHVQRLESIGTLADGIAHNLNNILAPAMLSVDFLYIQETDAEKREQLKTILDSLQRGASMVQHVMSFSRGVHGTIQHIHIPRLLEDVLTIVEDTFPENIHAEVRISEPLWSIQGDISLLQQALINLCINARDAMPEGGTLLLKASNMQVESQNSSNVYTLSPGPYVCLEVEDTGEGISKNVQDRIFEPFYTTKEIGKGTGLGLSTTYALAKGHGGHLSVNSQPGQGAVFTLQLPAIPESPPAKP
ncbi:MAG: PAS domain S-box protein [Kiritimatiellae bacterium]|jgi:PAS domain S-box-containing protein|nr:PAS domain S-box protein [Kiritimatiellia bacterium]